MGILFPLKTRAFARHAEISGLVEHEVTIDDPDGEFLCGQLPCLWVRAGFAEIPQCVDVPECVNELLIDPVETVSCR